MEFVSLYLAPMLSQSGKAKALLRIFVVLYVLSTVSPPCWAVCVAEMSHMQLERTGATCCEPANHQACGVFAPEMSIEQGYKDFCDHRKGCVDIELRLWGLTGRSTTPNKMAPAALMACLILSRSTDFEADVPASSVQRQNPRGGSPNDQYIRSVRLIC